MKINIKHLIRPWYFVAFSTFLALFIAIISIIVISDLRNGLYNARSLNDKVKEDIIVTERDNQLKTTAMYNLIISKYGNKYHKNYNRGKKRKHQGLEPRWQWPLFVRRCYDYERRLDIPHMTFVTFAKIETSFNPLAETRWEPNKRQKKKKKKGNLKEAGIFQHRNEAVGQALLFLKKLYAVNSKLADELEFKFNKMSDLFSPLNALKVQAILVWGYRQETARQMAWWTTFTHWGSGRIAPYYYYRKNKGILPDDFSFNKGTIKEDVRDPLQYFGLWFANWGQFSRFRIKVGVERWYDELYQQECSRLEWQFIQSWKYVRELKEGVEDLKTFQLVIKKEHKKKLDKIFKKAAEIDKKYIALHRQIKTGNFKKVSSIFKMWIVHFRDLMNELSPKKKATIRIGKKQAQFDKKIIVFYFFLVGFILLWVLNGLLLTIILIIRHKKRIKQNNSII